MTQPRITTWCARCGFKTTHKCEPERELVSNEDIGLPYRCERCNTVRAISTYAASLCERVD